MNHLINGRILQLAFDEHFNQFWLEQASSIDAVLANPNLAEQLFDCLLKNNEVSLGNLCENIGDGVLNKVFVVLRRISSCFPLQEDDLIDEEPEDVEEPVFFPLSIKQHEKQSCVGKLMKTIIDLLFLLLKHNWTLASSLNVPSLCPHVLETLLTLIGQLPPLTMSQPQELALSLTEQEGLEYALKFLERICLDEEDNSCRLLSCYLHLSISLQLGKLSNILQWTILALKLQKICSMAVDFATMQNLLGPLCQLQGPTFKDKSASLRYLILNLIEILHNLTKQNFGFSLLGLQETSIKTWGASGATQKKHTFLVGQIALSQPHSPLEYIAVSQNHSLALTKDGNVYSWGQNEMGQLGLGHTKNVHKNANLIQFFGGKKIKFVSCGHGHSGAVTENGQLFLWGSNQDGQLGLSDLQSRNVPCLSGLKRKIGLVSCGFNHTLVLSKDGASLWAFGDGQQGQLGLNSTKSCVTPHLVQFQRTSHSKIIKIAAAKEFSMVLTSMGELFVFGTPSCSLNTFLKPTILSEFMNKFIIDMDCNEGHFVALTRQGEVWAWGSNSLGQCGQKQAFPLIYPTRIDFDNPKFEFQSIVATKNGTILTTNPSISNLNRLILPELPYFWEVSSRTFELFYELLNNFSCDFFYESQENEFFLRFLLNLLKLHVEQAVKNLYKIDEKITVSLRQVLLPLALAKDLLENCLDFFWFDVDEATNILLDLLSNPNQQVVFPLILKRLNNINIIPQLTTKVIILELTQKLLLFVLKAESTEHTNDCKQLLSKLQTCLFTQTYKNDSLSPLVSQHINDVITISISLQQLNNEFLLKVLFVIFYCKKELFNEQLFNDLLTVKNASNSSQINELITLIVAQKIASFLTVNSKLTSLLLDKHKKLFFEGLKKVSNNEVIQTTKMLLELNDFNELHAILGRITDKLLGLSGNINWQFDDNLKVRLTEFNFGEFDVNEPLSLCAIQAFLLAVASLNNKVDYQELFNVINDLIDNKQRHEQIIERAVYYSIFVKKSLTPISCADLYKFFVEESSETIEHLHATLEEQQNLAKRKLQSFTLFEGLLQQNQCENLTNFVTIAFGLSNLSRTCSSDRYYLQDIECCGQELAKEITTKMHSILLILMKNPKLDELLNCFRLKFKAKDLNFLIGNDFFEFLDQKIVKWSTEEDFACKLFVDLFNFCCEDSDEITETERICKILSRQLKKMHEEKDLLKYLIFLQNFCKNKHFKRFFVANNWVEELFNVLQNAGHSCKIVLLQIFEVVLPKYEGSCQIIDTLLQTFLKDSWTSSSQNLTSNYISLIKILHEEPSWNGIVNESLLKPLKLCQNFNEMWPVLTVMSEGINVNKLALTQDIIDNLSQCVTSTLPNYYLSSDEENLLKQAFAKSEEPQKVEDQDRGRIENISDRLVLNILGDLTVIKRPEKPKVEPKNLNLPQVLNLKLLQIEHHFLQFISLRFVALKTLEILLTNHETINEFNVDKILTQFVKTSLKKCPLKKLFEINDFDRIFEIIQKQHLQDLPQNFVLPISFNDQITNFDLLMQPQNLINELFECDSNLENFSLNINDDFVFSTDIFLSNELRDGLYMKIVKKTPNRDNNNEFFVNLLHQNQNINSRLVVLQKIYELFLIFLSRRLMAKRLTLISLYAINDVKNWLNFNELTHLLSLLSTNRIELPANFNELEQREILLKNNNFVEIIVNNFVHCFECQSFCLELLEFLMVNGDDQRFVIVQALLTNHSLLNSGQTINLLSGLILSKACSFNVKEWAATKLASIKIKPNEEAYFNKLIEILPLILTKQQQYEQVFLNNGQQLMYSAFLRHLVYLSLSLDLKIESRLIADLTDLINSLNGKIKNEQNNELVKWFREEPQSFNENLPNCCVYSWGIGTHRFMLPESHINEPLTIDEVDVKTNVFPPVRKVVYGQMIVFVVFVNGSVFSCGEGTYGRLGHGSSDDLTNLTQISSLRNYHIIDLVASKGTGTAHILALSETGQVFSWGDGNEGKLGHDFPERHRRPKIINALKNEKVVQISCRNYNSAVVTLDGKLFTFGAGSSGELGFKKTGVNIPQRVMLLKDVKIGQVSCGNHHMMALSQDCKRLWGFGYGIDGCLGAGFSILVNEPLEIRTIPVNLTVKQVFCGSHMTLFLMDDGQVFVCGQQAVNWKTGVVSSNNVDALTPFPLTALQNYKISDVSVSDYHVLFVSECHKVFIWGHKIHYLDKIAFEPSLVDELTGRNIRQIFAGKSVNAAWTTPCFRANDDVASHFLFGTPSVIPLQYNYLQEMNGDEVKLRLIELYQFSRKVYRNLPVLPLIKHENLSLFRYFNELRRLVLPDTYTLPFNQALDHTMINDRSYGSQVTIKRRNNKSTFVRIAQQITTHTPVEELRLPSRAWKVTLIGEGADDAGGVFDDTITNICDELTDGLPPILIPTPNQANSIGFNQDKFLLNPQLNQAQHLNWFKFFGILLGVAIRTRKPLPLPLAPLIWKLIVFQPLTTKDVQEVDEHFIKTIQDLRNCPNEVAFKRTFPLEYFQGPNSLGQIVNLSLKSCRTKLIFENRLDFVEELINFRLHEFDLQVKAVQEGMQGIVPLPLFNIMPWKYLEDLVCGSCNVNVNELKKIVKYREFYRFSHITDWLWAILEDFSSKEKELFLRFVSGRSRLPKNVIDQPQRFQVIRVDGPKDGLPTAQTCFFQLRLPEYSSQKIMAERLRYAINNCKSIDLDNYMLTRNTLFDCESDEED